MSSIHKKSINCNFRNLKSGKFMRYVALFTTCSLIPMTAAANTQTESTEIAEIPSNMENASYSVGYEVGRTISALIEQTESTSTVKFQREKVIEGVRDAISKSPKLTREQIARQLTYLDTVTKDLSKTKEEYPDYQAGIKIQESAKKQKGEMATASGLLYRVIKPGVVKIKPSINSVVTLIYEGRLGNGRVFDSSNWRKQPSSFVVSDLTQGLQEGVLLMTEGSEYEFVIKPELAYKDQPQPNIPAYSTLIYRVKLSKID
ncbi:FKBP-type peptidyl-prolyl cis-trans isomerase [Vibrio sp. Y2-5]|uniref:FKBP-type peptidyl-prolyl cis-trans isomerase n=1 Tax=Vibrio sp. Y2-5 TaxID=2743977 RepID=UPI00166062CE|nr:FKBP-type peptidyl-prolyl cis-trans isomerase [Vibrio sp. Y2-5]MBD0788013.1 FKBP-type peptidyl-prolyl cis-trans isomerase [Vibrio sp. Y2-5]